MVLAVGCGEMDGRASHFPGTIAFESASGSYHFHYLSPPWQVLRRSGEVGDLAVASVDGAGGTGAPPSLRIEPIADDYGKAAADAAARASDGSAAFVATHPVRGPDGKPIGAELSWEDATKKRHFRAAYLAAGARGRCYRMRFEASFPLSGEPLVTLMIVSFEPRPAAGPR